MRSRSIFRKPSTRLFSTFLAVQITRLFEEGGGKGAFRPLLFVPGSLSEGEGP